MKKWLLVVLMLVARLAHAGLVEGVGKDYTRLAAPQPVANAKKVEVIEFFSYTCVHCYALDPLITAWAQKSPPMLTISGYRLSGVRRWKALPASSPP